MKTTFNQPQFSQKYLFSFNRLTSAIIGSLLSVTSFTGQIARVQALTIEDEFDASFLIVSPVTAIASHGSSSFIFGQSSSLNSNYNNLIPTNLTLTSSIEQIASNNYNLIFSLTTGTEAGFIPPRLELGGELINQWSFDLGNTSFSNGDGIGFPGSVIYNSAQGSWFDNGNLILNANYLPQVNFDSTATELRGQFEIALASGDLGSFGNGIDTFTLTVNITEPVAVPGPSASPGLVIFISLAGFLSRWQKAKYLNKL